MQLKISRDTGENVGKLIVVYRFVILNKLIKRFQLFDIHISMVFVLFYESVLSSGHKNIIR